MAGTLFQSNKHDDIQHTLRHNENAVSDAIQFTPASKKIPVLGLWLQRLLLTCKDRTQPQCSRRKDEAALQAHQP